PRAGGRTLIDHPTAGHDDYANALALAVARSRPPYRISARVMAQPRHPAIGQARLQPGLGRLNRLWPLGLAPDMTGGIYKTGVRRRSRDVRIAPGVAALRRVACCAAKQEPTTRGIETKPQDLLGT